MKNKIRSRMSVLLLALISIVTKVSAQDNVFAVEPQKMNVLYAGVENPLTIAYTAAYDSITISSGRLVPSGIKGEYTAYVSSGSHAFIQVYNGGKKVGEKNFRIKRIPQPKISVAGRTETSVINKTELHAVSSVGAVIPGFDFDITFKVTELEISFYTEGKLKLFIMSGNQLSEECRAALHKADKGKDIWFDAKVKGPDGSVRKLTPLKIHLTE